ncbi:DUF3465 domain-containing protein [Hydrogenophaga sp. PAMC20947]|uniref:DUF3465 domain-containing protein n=1 Tax=Hydrogenophaga sp. PAMC20947 TaxID=2565558 RepID=UPI00109DE3A0|nr:DUF3465 domain-containing protein [Hydrogenophaga sp. PAMC20947]QCB48377.1 DUF3465 domain-containing protein [Hydrogenophaga sp. PAMC20947]
MNKKLFVTIAVAAAVYFGLGQRFAPPPETPPAASSSARQSVLHNAIAEKRSGVQVVGQGTVFKLLKDDYKGSRHQRFLIELPGGATLLVAHNIDLAPRLNQLNTGDTVSFNGVYEWNAQGGVIHWTHHDPAGRHEGGWLKHNGQTYE